MENMDRDVARLVGMAGSRPPLPAERAFRIRTAVAPAWLGAVRARRRRRLGLVATIAVAATLLIAAGLALRSRTLPSAAAVVARAERVTGAPATVVSADGSTVELTEGLALRSGQRIAAGRGRAGLRLSNGSSLRIDAHTEVLFEHADLLSLGRGAIYVDSGSNARSGGERDGIVVRTALGTAREIGTRFEVRLDGETLRVRVRDGRVSVRGAASTVVGGALEEVTLHPDGRFDRSTIAAHDSEWEWVVDVAPSFLLENQELGAFLEWVERETGWEVRYDSPEIATVAPGISLHGHGRAISPEDALDVVMEACALSYRLDGGVLTIGTQEAAPKE
jgi:ferric-dicitrate binding protein FerR (iron transport regulator)